MASNTHLRVLHLPNFEPLKVAEREGVAAQPLVLHHAIMGSLAISSLLLISVLFFGMW